MRLRNNNFAAALDELKRRHIVKTQKELAQKMGVSEDTITRILKVRTEVTEDVITKLQTASGCIFNIQWLRGEDKVMLAEDLINNEEISNPQESAKIDADFYHNALELNAKVIGDLRKDLDYFKQMVLDKDGAIQDNAAEIISLQSRLAAATNELERVKATLKAVRENFDSKQTELDRCNQIISTLQRQLDSTHINSPIPFGTAEPGGIKSNLLATDD